MDRLGSLIAAVLFFFTFSPHLLAANTPPWGDLSAWVGKYPTEQESGQTKRLLGLPAVRTELRALLSNADFKRLNSVFTVEKPIVKTDRFLVVQQCMPHNCPGAHAMVVLDSEDKRLWVGIFERTEKSVSTRWGGTDDYTLLPPSILDSFRRAHMAD
jgi:hypothetical protein